MAENDIPFDLLNISPYQFEPPAAHRRDDSPSPSSDHDSHSEDGASGGEEEAVPVAIDTWCSCSNCIVMPTAVECVCCHSFPKVLQKLKEGEVNNSCIIQHDGFAVNFLNRHVLELALIEFVGYEGPLDDNDPIHETYRYIPYRRYTRWIHGKLKKHDRRPIPSCVVKKIRDTFPSENSTGFKYFRPQ